MDVISTELIGNESNTLYFIGNGFDLFHDLKTSYWNFHEWLVTYNYADDFVATLEQLFPAIKDGELLLWKDFETALGQYTLKQVHDDFFQGVDDGLFDNDIQESVVNRIRPQLERIPALLRKWIKTVPLENLRQRLDLSKKSFYLTFNYTLLLEEVYYIPLGQIMHIHGCLKDNSPLITGHGEDKQEDNTDYGSINIEESLRLISQEMYKLKKPVKDIITQHQPFFDSLKEITHVVVFGQSLSEIDMPYFCKILCNVQDNTKWYFIVYDDTAKDNYKRIVNNFIDDCPKVYGRSRYLSKMKPENCKYIYTKDLKTEPAYEYWRMEWS